MEENYSRARELCEQLGETTAAIPRVVGAGAGARCKRGAKPWAGGRESSFCRAQRAQESSIAIGGPPRTWANLSVLGELTSAWTHLDQGFSLYDPQKHRHHAFLYGGHDPGVCCGYHARHVLWLLGYPDHALQRSREAVALARELSQASTLQLALSFDGVVLSVTLVTEEAIQALVDECTTLVNQQGFTRGPSGNGIYARMAFS